MTIHQGAIHGYCQCVGRLIACVSYVATWQNDATDFLSVLMINMIIVVTTVVEVRENVITKYWRRLANRRKRI